ncbi:hypothetical protein [Luteolibacter soli]|uniref:Anti-sigma factor n=1 Tax=Luteolibacter soli TaxID=3135280 RepID=A0ABU9ATF8_9BACT
MNSDHDLEELLGRLSPAAPGPELMERLREARPPEKKPRSLRRLWLLLPPLAAAAGVAFAWLGHEPPAAPQQPIAEQPSQEPLKPVGSVQHLMEVADLGIVVGEDQQPVRLIRTRWIDEVVYARAGGGEPVKEGRLREEVLPVSLDLY